KPRQELLADNSHDQHGEKTCTPFCYCSCCPASVFTGTGNHEALIEENPASSKAIYTPSFYSFNFHSIWQPPKLG
ncbi:MAG: hypothetical protein ABUT20_13330, partial [Bacteroidota bacterium]